MKNKIKLSFSLILSIIIISFSCVSKEKKEKADEYVGIIGSIKNPVTDSINSIVYGCRIIVDNFLRGDSNLLELKKINFQIDKALLQVDVAIVSLNSIEEFDDKILLKVELSKYLTVIRGLIDEDFRTMFNMLEGEVTEAKIVSITDVYLSFSLKLIEIEKFMDKVENDFAEKYSIQIKTSGQNWEQMEKKIKDQIKQNEERKELINSYTYDEVIYDE
jgi:hypothetical protein